MTRVPSRRDPVDGGTRPGAIVLVVAGGIMVTIAVLVGGRGRDGLAYAINPDLASNSLYLVIVMLAFFWLSMLINARGVRASSMLGMVGTIAGSIIPALLVIGLGVAYLVRGASLIVQGVGGTVFSLLFLLIPNVSTSYWMLSAVTAQIVIIMHGLMFAAVIRLRYSQPEAVRPYRIPGGKVGVWIVGGVGLLGCVVSFILGFGPPGQLKTGNPVTYVLLLLAAVVILSAPLVNHRRAPRWHVPGWLASPAIAGQQRAADGSMMIGYAVDHFADTDAVLAGACPGLLVNCPSPLNEHDG